MHCFVKNNNLILDFTELLNYSCFVVIEPWDTGIAWYSLNEGEIEGKTHLDELGFGFSYIKNQESASLWLKKIPEELQEKILIFEKNFKKPIFPLLWFLSRYQSCQELFISHPFLMWLILHKAKINNWDEQYIVALFSKKRIEILKICGLSGSNSMLKFLKKLRFDYYTEKEVEFIQDIQNIADIFKLNHLNYISYYLLHFIQRWPQFVSFRLLRIFDEITVYHEIESYIEDTFRMGERLNIVQTMVRLENCRTLKELENIHDQYVLDINKNTLRPIDIFEYGPPPIPGNKNIQPIQNSAELLEEARSQKNCVMSYHYNIVKKSAYIYKTNSPERATFSLKMDQNSKPSISEIKLKMNEEPSEETKQMIFRWFNAAIQKVDPSIGLSKDT